MKINKVLQSAHQYYQAGDLNQARNLYKKILRVKPNNIDALHFLGMICSQLGDFDDAIRYINKEIQITPSNADVYDKLGTVLQKKGLFSEAIDCFRKAITLKPRFPAAYYNLGVVFHKTGQIDEAILNYQKAIQIEPGLIEAYHNLGILLNTKGHFDEAITCYQKAIQLSPNLYMTYNNLGVVLRDKGQLNEAITCYQKAIQLNPNYADAYNNLGSVLKDRGQLNEAETYFKRALQIKPCSTIHGNLLFNMNYNSRYNPQDIFSEHLLFAKKFAETLSSAISPHTNERQPNKRLRIGYCSPDFRGHAVAYFIEPVLVAHNREHFEVFCYPLVPIQDEVTNRIRNYSDKWRSIVGMSDEDAALLIRNDKIDILIDLAGHTASNRILLFARKPAPIQVSWIGYPATSGLSAMDFKIVDSYTDPPGMTEEYYTEKLLRMPESFLCYVPDSESPYIGPLPALTAGYITFGSFNNFAKVTLDILKLWAEILRLLPQSRLLLKTQSFSDDQARRSTLDIFRSEGIDDSRVELHPPVPSVKEHLNVYNRIDIALDTFPYHGTTTTYEALWMGVPVITLAGKSHASRVGVSILSNVGLPELIAQTHDEFIGIALNLGSDIENLQLLRKSLRDRISHSPLTDAKRFTANLEMCYRKIWENWCNSTQV